MTNFLGLRTFEGSAGKFHYGVWVADHCGEQVPSHEHKSAHFMWAIVGHYETQVQQPHNQSSDIVIFNPAGTEHRDRFLTTGAFFSLDFSNDESVRSIPSPVSIDHNRIRGLFWKICNEASDRERNSPMLVEGLCYDALSMVECDNAKRKAPPHWLKRACAHLREEKQTTISNIANQIGIHPTHFVRAFKNCMQCTPGEFRRLVNLQMAATKMIESHYSIAEIAADIGYTDQSHFTKHFRRAFGVTPGAYRAIRNQ